MDFTAFFGPYGFPEFNPPSTFTPQHPPDTGPRTDKEHPEMPGPAPKDPSTRARRNTKSTKTELTRRELRSVDDLTDLTVAELRTMIAELNLDRPGDQQLEVKGRKAALAARVIAAESPVPTMPKHPTQWDDEAAMRMPVEWDQQTAAWWNDVWTSPMVSAWDDSDVHNVYVIALLYDDIWAAGTPRERKDALAEFRQQCARVGLDPVSRARLQWTIEGADEAKARGDRRRQSTGQPGSARRLAGTDPRHGLTSVK